MKIYKLNFEKDNFGELFTQLKTVGLTQVMSQIEAKIKKRNLQVGFGEKKICLSATEKILAGGPYAPPPGS